jgi:predicted DNA-binding WGR domain protein
MPVNTEDHPLLSDKELTVAKELKLSCVNEKSNKGYLIRLELSKKNGNAQIFSSWGKNENDNWVKEWRHYETHEKATKEFESIVKSKKKKGYEEV